jgi:MFS family permease
MNLYVSDLSPLRTPSFLCLSLLPYGIGYGGHNTLRASLVRQFFGRSNFGTIHGLVIFIMMLGSIAGPPLAGHVFDNWDSYRAIWFVFAGLAVVALIVMATTPPVSATIQPADKY